MMISDLLIEFPEVQDGPGGTISLLPKEDVADERTWRMPCVFYYSFLDELIYLKINNCLLLRIEGKWPGGTGLY